MDPWRYSTEGISVALRVTPRGGRDDIDGIETLANGRSVVKVRVRAIADGGEANRAVTELLAKVLGVPKARVKVLSGTTSRSPTRCASKSSVSSCTPKRLAASRSIRAAAMPSETAPFPRSLYAVVPTVRHDFDRC